MKQLVDSLAEELPPTKQGRVGLGLDGYPHGESAAAGSSSELHGLCTGCHARSSESTPWTPIAIIPFSRIVSYSLYHDSVVVVLNFQAWSLVQNKLVLP
ncbi:hypothetical protein PGT21_015760 [Puccinia graminis f. sp. tritici]|uniref:Uncharacterized protein n=1 Tax=Puccinia graminis f. sp. tritici TaxID=56615 RepID=A0A5B0QTJ2_PUCGR|nr:hypothetical protein PGT21_015760 [Puccinia graminis f. sp. tritici]